MRAPALALLALLVVPGLPARADEPPRLDVRVGEEHRGLGTLGRCDDLSVVGISTDGTGVRGLKPGSTICSFDTSGGGGIRRIYRVVVSAPTDNPSPSGAPSRGG